MSISTMIPSDGTQESGCNGRGLVEGQIVRDFRAAVISNDVIRQQELHPSLARCGLTTGGQIASSGLPEGQLQSSVEVVQGIRNDGGSVIAQQTNPDPASSCSSAVESPKSPCPPVPDRKDVLVAVPVGVDFPRGVAGDKWASFLQLLLLHTALTPERRGGHYINFHHRYLEKVIGHGYAETIGQLTQAGIIEVNGRYSTGREGTAPFTKSYRLSAMYRHGRATLHCVRSIHAQRRASRSYEVDPAEMGPAGMYYRTLFDQFGINAGEASRDPAHDDPWTQAAIARFANGHEFACRCQYRRYHCLATQLPRECRRYLSTCQNEQLALVDVSACQPVLLARLATIASSSHTGGNQTGETSQQLSYDRHFWRAKATTDVLHWLKLAESREIYRFFQDELVREPGSAVVEAVSTNGHKYSIDLRQSSPAAFKRSCLIPLFQNVPDMLASPIYKLIERHFPNIADYLLQAKRDRYQEVACALQRAESGLMIDGLGGELERRYPGEPVQPIHDALLVRESFAATASDLIKEQFAGVGLFPQVKQELLN